MVESFTSGSYRPTTPRQAPGSSVSVSRPEEPFDTKRWLISAFTALVPRVNVLTSVMPLILVVTICTLATILYLAYRRWYRRSTSAQPAPPAQQPSPAHAPLRRQHIRRLPGLPVYNSQVTLPRYWPPPPSYRERQAEYVEHVELVEINPGRSSENQPAEQESSPAASPAPSI